MLFHQLNDSAYKDYVVNLGQKLKADPKCFWKFVSDKRQAKGLPLSVEFKGQHSTSDQERCDFFAEYMQSVYSPPLTFDETDFEYLQDMPKFLNTDIELTNELVYESLLKLDTGKGPGPDGLPPLFLRNVAGQVCNPLFKLFEISFKTGYFPRIWKKSFLTPIHKSGKRTKVENYRGIAILSVIPKLFEKIVCDQVTSSIVSVLDVAQHGFEKKKSTTTNLVEFYTFLNDSMSKGTQVDALYTDFSKAFDKVDHALLIHKLSSLGLNRVLLNWLSSYLHDRKLSVKIDCHLSRDVNATSGVPQGSHLGPLLFLVFVNDITMFLNDVQYLLYADDLKIFRTISDPQETTILQEGADAIFRWCESNGMLLNIGKCNVISFTRKHNPIHHNYKLQDTTIERVDVIKDLGVWFDCKLNFKRHINITIAKANSVLSLIKRFAKEFNDLFVIKSLYTSLVLSIIEYGSIVWMPAFEIDIKRIESIQKQFLLFCLRDLGWHDRFQLPSYRHRLNLLSMLTIRDRQEMACCLFVFDVINNNIRADQISHNFEPNIQHYNLRQKRTFRQAPTRTIYSANSTINRCVNLFNNKCQGLSTSGSKSSFKLALRTRIVNSSYK